MTHCLDELVGEETGRLYEEPVGRMNEFEVGLVVCVVDLCVERFIGVYELFYLFFERAYSHGGGHADGERVMELHFFFNVLHVLISEEETSSWVMWFEGGDIEDVVVVEEKSFLILLGVGSDLL